MKLKTTFYILGVVLLSGLVSCLGETEELEYVIPSDATISSFSIEGGNLYFLENGKKDSIINGLNGMVFSIDQMNSKIFNRDSARYGIILPDSVIVKYTTALIRNAAASAQFQIYNIVGKDTLPLRSGKDKISLSKPLTIRSYAANGDWKDYTFQFNIHQVDPEAFWWKKVNSNLEFLNYQSKTVIFDDIFYCFAMTTITYPGIAVLHVSSDMGVSWGESINTNMPFNAILSQMQQFGKELFVCTATGELYKASINDGFTSWEEVPAEYPVKNVFGAINKTNAQTSVLASAVEKEGLLVSATFDGNNWEYGNELPKSFPQEDFSSISALRANTGFLSIAGGIAGTTWRTTDGLNWVQMNVPLPPNTQGANIFLYDAQFYLLNGGGNKSIYTSRDGGNIWQVLPEKVNLPAAYTSRTGASVVVDGDNIIYIIGGQNAGNRVTDIWKGRINKLN